MIKVSIVIPTYNRRNLILRTLESVYSQLYKNIEVIVIDDGSTDNTKELVDEYIQKHNLIYHYQENKGRSEARNLGIKVSSGDFLMFLDSDDYLEPDAVSTLVSVYERYPNVNIFAASYRLIEENILGHQYEIYRREFEYINQNILIEQVKGMILNVGNNIIRKTLIEKYGGFEPGLEYAEDWNLLVNVCSNERAVVIKKVILNILRHDNNSSFFAIQDSIITISKRFLSKIKLNKFSFDSIISSKLLIVEFNKRIAMAYNRKGEKWLSLKYFTKVISLTPYKVFTDTNFIKELVFLGIPTKLLIQFRRLQLKIGSKDIK